MPKYKYTCHKHDGVLIRYENWGCPLCRLMAQMRRHQRARCPDPKDCNCCKNRYICWDKD